MIWLILQLAIYLYPRQHICWASPEALELFLLASVVVSFLGVCRARWPEVSRLFFACWLGGFSTLAWLAHPPLVVALAAPTLILYCRQPVQPVRLRLA
ncbi:hypothetical protein IV102_11070 [bacterium]|nr:hypothetical protein [bacterium]